MGGRATPGTPDRLELKEGRPAMGRSHHLAARVPVISLGAGVQSSALALMATEGRFGARPELAVFADTGWEPAAVYAQLDWLTEQLPYPVERVSAGNIRDDAVAAADGHGGRFASMPLHLLNRDGTKGQLRRQCTKEYKLAPIRRRLRALGLNHVEMWLGISLDEWQRMKPSSLQWIENRWPLIEAKLTRADCRAWLAERGMPEPPKSACIGCPYMDNSRWLDLRENRSSEWQDAVAVDRALRHLPRIDGEVFLHASLTPLDDAVLDPSDVGQLDFDGECEGMCGV